MQKKQYWNYFEHALILLRKLWMCLRNDQDFNNGFRSNAPKTCVSYLLDIMRHVIEDCEDINQELLDLLLSQLNEKRKVRSVS